jgi:hypothetical protein
VITQDTLRRGRVETFGTLGYLEGLATKAPKARKKTGMTGFVFSRLRGKAQEWKTAIMGGRSFAPPTCCRRSRLSGGQSPSCNPAILQSCNSPVIVVGATKIRIKSIGISTHAAEDSREL